VHKFYIIWAAERIVK